MDTKNYIGFCLLILIIQSAIGQIQKSSITFVIDDTGSMHNDIVQVKYGVNLVFDTVLNSNASQIENFILVTFNDPGTKLRTVTKDRNVFKNSLESIIVDGGADCPEMAMAGIELALEVSLPGSFIYVLTDASAKDYGLLEKMQNLAMKKLTQIVFLLTGRCLNEADDEPQYQAYYKLAEATNGQVFHMDTSNVGEILKYVAETVTSRKTVVTTKKFPPGYDHNMTIPVDADMKDVVIAGSGLDPKIHVTAPDGTKPHTEPLVDIPRVVAVKIKDTKPGNYTAKVGSKSETSVVVTATTNIQFKHGFSVFEPFSIDATTTNPMPDQESHLSIQLITTEDEAILNTAVLTDLDENVIIEIPLQLIDSKQKLYDTALFMPPNSSFKITVKGYDNKSKSSFSRTSPTPIEPQKPLLVKYDNKAPTITIAGGRNINAEYNEPLKLLCKVNGFPKPDTLWLDSDGSILPSAYSTLEIPYDYINVLNIDKIKNNATYTCKAANTHGEVSEIVKVMTIKKNIFNVIEAPKDTTIKYRNSGQVSCKIEADPPAKIKWLSKGKELRPDKYIDISPDDSVLTIKDMRRHLNGTFVCKVEAGTHKQQFIFNVAISGYERPQIVKTDIESTSKRGEYAEVSCRIIKGEPTPKLVWYHLSPESQQFVKLNESDEVLHFPNVDEEDAGFYRCLATNDVGRDHHMFEIIVEYPPSISDDNTYVTSREGRETSLQCRTKGVPKPRVSWFLNGVKILSDRRHHIYRDNSLRFTGSTDNAGLFTCVATNYLGSVNKTIKVDYFVPVTIDPPKESTFEVTEGDNLQLPCRADGYPQPRLNWVFFSLADKKTSSRKMRPSDVSGQLNLKTLRSSQDGFYTCIASNVESSANITYRIKFIAPPKIESGPTTTFTGVNGDLVMRLPCKAYGYPKPVITWSRRGLNVASGSEWYNIQEDGTLDIKNLDETSAGAYTCMAENALGVDKQTYFVIVKPSPDTTATKTIFLEDGKPSELDCDIPHTILDTIRWYKDKRPIGMDASVKLENVKISDSGIYTCRVSNFAGSLSESKRVVVGYKPRFVANAEPVINFSDGMPAFLDCEAVGKPQPQVTWFDEDEEIDNKDPIYELLMTFNQRGKYTCVVSNQFGSINRTFEISSKDCLLSIEDDFTKNQPLMVDGDTFKLPQENSNGYLKISSNNGVLLYCPGGFANFPKNKVTAICERETDFLVDGYIYSFSDLSCQEEVQPTIRRTGRQCRSKNTEQIKIGYELLGDFLEIFEVCVNKDGDLPIYSKQKIHRSLADVELKHPMWQHDSLPFEFDELYECDTQINVITSTLRQWFHAEDRCCFDKRQLVNTRDLPVGLPQKAALNYLNVVPHWSTCNAKNWDELEKRVRILAKSSFDNILVWTGTSGQLTLKNSMEVAENITLMDTRGRRLPVPQYIWKVIQSPNTKSSLAVIQVNSPDLPITEAYLNMVCRDVCRDVEWMSGVNWRDPANGYTFCCSLPDFERAFGYTGHFGLGNDRILRDVSGWSGTCRNMSTNIEINEGYSVKVKNEEPIKLVCNLEAYPKPDI